LHWVLPEYLHPQPSALQVDWLLDSGSLTRRLTWLAEGDFAVHVRREGWQSLRADECAALDVACGHAGWVREVVLVGQGQPWVFARSVAAQRTLDALGIDLGQVGQRSLGEVLFCAPLFSRSALELCHYPAGYLPPDVRQGGLCARRSCFGLKEARVLVAEVYLPALWARLCAGVTLPGAPRRPAP